LHRKIVGGNFSAMTTGLSGSFDHPQEPSSHDQMVAQPALALGVALNVPQNDEQIESDYAPVAEAVHLQPHLPPAPSSNG
jgi:hypothetical protein